MKKEKQKILYNNNKIKIKFYLIWLYLELFNLI